jgi:preprotein translocase subunit SecA
MNKQRTVIYTKRQHALFGERLALDLDNAFYSVAEELVSGFRAQDDHEGFKVAAIMHFAIDTTITEDELIKGDLHTIVNKLYEEAIGNYNRRKSEMMRQAVPVFQNVRQQQGSHIENVVVPFTDGKKGINVVASLDKTVHTEGRELASALERSITLAVIDDSWKEHLRAMDDLRQSVQTAVYEQKDPLVIYKASAFELFSNMNSEVNREIVSFLCYCGIPVQENQQTIREGREQKTDMSRMKVRKEELAGNAGSREPLMEPGNDYHDPSTQKQEPVRSGPRVGRNDPCPCGSGKKFKACHGTNS